jgi:hypothetical protein
MDAFSRRSLLASAAAAAMPVPAQQGYWGITAEVVKRHDDAVDRMLGAQTTDPSSPWRGGYPDSTGLHNGGSAAGLLSACAIAYVHKQSRHHRSGIVLQRIGLAAEFLKSKSSPDGNIDLLITNFNSPPDTAFAMIGLATACSQARKHGAREVSTIVDPLVRLGAIGLTQGGIHTPNHRWVVCAALAHVNELFPNPGYVRRIDQWLAEGMDIDSDGQYTERSTAGYNGVTNRALTTLAVKGKRPELLDYVRRNIDSTIYLLHPGNEPATEISRRQDQYTRGSLAGYWLALRYLAVKDGNGVYETLARQHQPSLADLMEYPELTAAGPEPKPVPDNYEKLYPFLKVARVRRGLTSATVLLDGNSRFFSLHRGDAVIEAVRFSSAFFGKGQFVPSRGEKKGDTYELSQSLEGPYYQPLNPPRQVGTEDWEEVRRLRKQTEVCKMSYAATITETRDGFRLRIRAEGTGDVPLAIEIALRSGGKLEGGEALPDLADAWILGSGHAVYRAGGQSIRFGPGKREHTYTQVRGAHPRVPGPSVYLTGYTPFDHTLEFVCG